MFISSSNPLLYHRHSSLTNIMLINTINDNLINKWPRNVLYLNTANLIKYLPLTYFFLLVILSDGMSNGNNNYTFNYFYNQTISSGLFYWS